VVRVATRWGGEHPPSGLLRLAAALQMTLRGTPCIYQGDELGLPEAVIDFDDIQDPYGLTMWPEFKGRDGCRTPLPWVSKAVDLGFSPSQSSAASPWLPVSEMHRALAVDVQLASADSLFAFYQNLLHWRKSQSALVQGELALLASHSQVLAYVRTDDAQRILCLFNFSEASANWVIPDAWVVRTVLLKSGLSGATLVERHVHFEPWGGMLLLLD
jgi:alpha-glucosidase